MTEEIEAHILKKYEILQKLGKSQTNNECFMILYKVSISAILTINRKGSLWYCVEGNRQKNKGNCSVKEEL